MGTSQKYSLRWNDFSLNVATTFRDLHSQQDFVDVTLACADGSTIAAHKVILSSVSTYFRDILKNAPSKHPIIILKDTLREEAQAMLEFAYTGEVNVGQDLLPSLLHTARCYKIKGLDNVQTPPGLLEQNAAGCQGETDSWAGPGSLPPTRPHTPSTRPHTPRTRPSTPSTRPHSPHSVTHPHSPNSVQGLHTQGAGQREHQLPDSIKPFQREQEHWPLPPRAYSQQSQSQPPTRPCSPVSHGYSMPPSPQSNARTPPPKRWKRSFDLARGDESNEAEAGQPHNGGHHQLPQVPQPPASLPQHGSEFGESVAKRFCEKRYSLETEREKRFQEADSNQSLPAPVTQKRFVPPSPSLTYPHSLPASPTMFDSRNLAGLGILRHFARVGSQEAAKAEAPREAHENSLRSENREREQGAALDYRFQPSSDQPELNGRSERRTVERQAGEREEPEAEVARRERLTVFRPESAPTVLAGNAHVRALQPLDMSPEASLQGPPGSAHDLSTDGMDHDERLSHFRNIVVGTLQPVTSAGDLSDCVSKALNTSGGGGRYSCDECGKLFKHPGSLQHHRHIHRGTHKCPSCGKAFSRRWDMERHLNKSKYGCPANRFGNGMEGEAEQSPGGHESRAVVTSVTQMEAASGGQVSQVTTHGLTLTSLPHSDAALVTLLPSHINGTSH